MNKRGDPVNENDRREVSRRRFLRMSGRAAAGAAAGSTLSGLLWLDDAVAAIPAAGAYLLVDTKKCQGCMTCMLSCSLVHEGKENLSLARIQVIQNPFANFPEDIDLAQCRQCVEPACLEACPTDALYVDGGHGNVRRIDEEKCIGCMLCVKACGYAPSRSVWDHEEGHAQKCDLCAEAPFWKEPGGPDGKQACVTLCPIGALAVTKEIPEQAGDEGYQANLRGEGWKNLRFSEEPEQLRSEKTGELSMGLLVMPYAGRWEARTDLGSGKAKTEGQDA